MLLRVLFAVANLLGAATAAPSPSGGKREAEQSWVAIPPKQDPWYTAPKGFETAAEGAILRIRAAPGNILETIPNAFSAYNVLYRSTDSRDLPSWAVTTILVPTNAAYGPDGPNALLSYQIAYDSADLDASPIYILSTVSDDGHGAPSFVQDIEEALAFGWYVTVPDYEGPLASCKFPDDAIQYVLDTDKLQSHCGTSGWLRYS
jgi:hypothetical protein